MTVNPDLMRDDRDTELAVRAWLQPGADRLPAHVRHAVLVEISNAPQTVAGVARIPSPRGHWAWTLILAGILVAAAVAVGLLGRTNGVATESPSHSPESSDRAAASTTALPTAFEQSVLPIPRPTVEGAAVEVVIPAPAATAVPIKRPTPSARPLIANGPLTPGRYAIPHVAGTTSDYKAIEVTIPAGWSVDGRRIVKHAGQDDEIALSWWVVGDVYFDPCHWPTSPASPIDLTGHQHNPSGTLSITEPPTAGLAGQLGRVHSELTQTHIGGQLALKIDLLVSTRLAIEYCDQGRYVSWSDRGSDQAVNGFARPGQVDVVYMVDVDREPLVIDVSHGPGVGPTDIAELQTIVDSMVIER